MPENIELPGRVESITTGGPTAVAVEEATLYGNVSLTDSEPISCGIIYGSSSSLSSLRGTKERTTANGDYSVRISGLSPNTQYYYRAYAVDAGAYRYGEVRSFKTSVSIATGYAVNITYNKATLKGTLNSSNESITCGIIYGTSSSLSSTSGTKKSTTSSGSFSVDVTGLSPNTTYYYRAYAVVDDEYKYGEVSSFKTAQEVTVTTGMATFITDKGATLDGVVNNSETALTCGIIYGTSSSLSSTSGTKKSTTSSGSFSVDVTGLSPNTTYYYRAYAVVDDEYKYGEVCSFKTSLNIDGYEAVDLGLSVKWASCNVGAESPEDYGDYFAWGETTTKSSYSLSNSATYGLSTSTLKSRGIIDASGNLTAAYDAATANWGSAWRMPTLDEMKELINNCSWSWITQNGVKGYKVTGPNGNSIFLPAAGSRNSTSLNGAGSYGLYWSATPYSDSYNAYYLGFGSGDYGWYDRLLYYGLTVRPVSE